MEPGGVITNTQKWRLIRTSRNATATGLPLQINIDWKYWFSEATHLSWIRPLHSLHGDALSRPPRVPLLRHSLAVRSKGPHSRSSCLVHAHGRPAHVRVVHSGCHPGWIHPSGGASWTWLVHELVVVGLSGAHLEGRAHLQTHVSFQASVRSLLIFVVI